MRHIYAYRATYLIATLIVLVAMLFAWLRSQDVPPLQQEEGMRHDRPYAVQVAAPPYVAPSVAVKPSSPRHASGPSRSSVTT